MSASQGQISNEQLELFLDYLDDHHDLARGRLRNAEGRIVAKRLWEEITIKLNSIGGSVKTAQQWSKVWTDRKHLAKKNAAANCNPSTAAGDDPSCKVPLAQWEIRVLDILGESFAEAQTTACVSAFPHKFDMKVEMSSDSTSSHSQQRTLPQTSFQPVLCPQTAPKPSQNFLEDNHGPVALTIEQLDMLLDFMDEHRKFARGRLRTADGRVKAKSLWEELTNMLNTVGGSVKTVQQWQKVWTDRKHAAKKSVAAVKKAGGVPPGELPIAPWELRVLEIIGDVLVEHKTVAPASDLPENLDLEDDLSSDALSPQHPQQTLPQPSPQSNRPSQNIKEDNHSQAHFLSSDQFEMLLDFMDEHRDLACGRLRNADGRPKAKRLWEEVTYLLNSVGGSQKTMQQWQKVWSDRKHVARKNAAAIRSSGGERPDDVTISPWEPRVLDILSSRIRPHSSEAESALPQNFDFEEDSSDSLPQNQPQVLPQTDQALPQTSTEAPLENSQDFEESLPVTTEQLRTLLDFMDQNRDLACGRLRSVDGRVKATKLWAWITNKLNSLQGSVKTVQQWQKLWTDRKHIARKSVAKKNALGGGPTEWELRILNIVGNTSGEPLIKPPEPAFSQEFDDDDELPSDSSQHFEPQILPKQQTTAVEVEFIPVQDTSATHKCRICLHDGSIYIFRETGPHDIPKYITALTGVLIKRNDNLPKYICDECYESLETAILFRKTAQLTHLLLKRNKSRFPFKRLRPIPIRFQRNEVESKRVKVESGRKNVLVKQEPTSEEDESENYGDNSFNSDSPEDKNSVCVKSTIEPEVTESEQSECTKTNVSVKREVTSDDDTKPKVKDDFRIMRKEKEDRANLNLKEIVNEYKIAKESFDDRTYTEHVKIRKKIGEIIKKRKKIECKLCKKYLYNSECYIKHMKCFHKNEPDNDTIKRFEDRIQCEICKKQIVYFKYHSHVKNVHLYIAQTLTKVETETKKPTQKTKRKKVPQKRECHICKKTYNRRYYITHMELHKMKESGEPAQCICEVCGRLFKLQTTLRAHQATHSNEFPFICTYCPYRGRTNELLKLHVLTHTGDYPYKCPHCPNRSTCSSNLRKHMRIHDGKFKLHCDTCEKGFHTKPDLDRHVRAKHLGIKDHVCNICGMEFGYRRGMLQHQFKVHKRAKLRARAKPLYLRLEDENLMEKIQ